MNRINTKSPDRQQSVSENYKNDTSTAQQRLEVRTVKFLGTRKIYSNKSDISVRYKVGARTPAHRKDRIVLVDATSGSPRETLAFRFAPRYVAADRTFKVLFKYRFLPPSDPHRYYQFLYVTRQKQVIGSSTKFSIRDIESDVRSTYADSCQACMRVGPAPTAADDSMAHQAQADSKTLISETSLTDAIAKRTDISSKNGCDSSEACLTLLPLTFSRHAHVFSEKCRQMLNTGASIFFRFETGTLNWTADPAKTSLPINGFFGLPIKLDNVVNFLHLLAPTRNAETDASRGTPSIQRTAANDKEAPTGEAGSGCGMLPPTLASRAPTFKSSVEKQLVHKAWDVAQLSTEVSENTNVNMRLPAGSGCLDLRGPVRVNRRIPDLPRLDFFTNISGTARRSIQHAVSGETWRVPVGVVSDAAAEDSPVGSRLSNLRLSEQLCQLQRDFDELRVRLDSTDEKTAGQERSADDLSAAQQLSDVAHLLLRLFADLRTQLAEKENAVSSLRREVSLQARECSRLRSALAAERKRRVALAKCVSELREAEPRFQRDAATSWRSRADRRAPQCTPDVRSVSDDVGPFRRTPGFRKPSAKGREQFRREAKGEKGEATTTDSVRFKTLAENGRRLVIVSTSTEFQRKATVGGNAPDAMYYYL